jgi:MurNAc alpha-1-phosphate uridylyltransferase
LVVGHEGAPISEVGGRVGHFSQTLAKLFGVNNTSSNSAFPGLQQDDGHAFQLPLGARPSQAMLLAAGRGERMRPLTDHTPKPLLKVHGKPLLAFPLEALARSGVQSVVINTGWLGEQIEPTFGQRLTTPSLQDRASLLAAGTSLKLRYSHEGRGAGEALETAGGIVRALPLLDDVFWVAAGDVYAPDFAFSPEAYERFKASPQLAHLWLVPNPEHNPGGDFGLSSDGMALNLSKAHQADGATPAGFVALALFTFSTMALYKRAFFEAAWCPIPAGNPHGVKAPLAAMLRAAMDQGLVGASMYEGLWVDVGTPERLAQLNS